jgi:tetratricopeptide (TPR) repeat protein
MIAVWLCAGLLMIGLLVQQRITAQQKHIKPVVADTRPVMTEDQRQQLNADIDQQVAGLVPARPDLTLTADKAMSVREDLKKGDYKAAAAIAGQVLDQSSLVYGQFEPFSDFVQMLSDEGNEGYLKTLDEWCDAEPKIALPFIVRSHYYFQTGWKIRGNKYSPETNSAAKRIFSRDISLAIDDATTAVENDPDSPYAHFNLVRTLASDGNSKDLQDAFDAGIAKFPDYYGLYEMRLDRLAPKWGGSIAALYAFANKYAAPAADTSPLKFLYLKLYEQLLNVASLSCSDLKDDLGRKCVNYGMAKLVRPDMEKNIKDTLSLYGRNDPYEFSKAFRNVVATMREDGTNVDPFTDKVVGWASDVIGTHGNFLMDNQIAGVSFRAGNYDAAIAGYKQSLADLDGMKLPDAESRVAEQAHIYTRLAVVYKEAGDYKQSIVYAKATTALGFPDSEPACYDYHALKDYKDALIECGKAYGAGSMASLYWLARTNAEMGNQVPALIQYRILANSKDQTWRGNAIINGSILIDDPQGVVDWFNAFPDVFDENSKTVNQETIADAYNNRCYAYQRLGELQKALDDCNASLRHGDLQLAAMKRQQILQALKNKPSQ